MTERKPQFVSLSDKGVTIEVYTIDKQGEPVFRVNFIREVTGEIRQRDFTPELFARKLVGPRTVGWTRAFLEEGWFSD